MRGFTVFELLAVFTIIGILGTIALIVMGGARNDARDAMVLRQMESVHAAVTRCLFEGRVMYCAGKQYALGGALVGEQNCRDSGTPLFSHVPAMNVVGGTTLVYDDDSALCGDISDWYTETREYGTWPDIAQHGFRYGTRADSNFQQGMFAFYAFDETPRDGDVYTVVCCTQTECTVAERSAADMAFFGVGTDWPMTGFCLEQAGFSFDEGDTSQAITDGD
jgi:Tfp pilus assembly major pilin PilA